jgi:hypothetical protein
LLVLLPACGGGGDFIPPVLTTSGETGQRTLSGTVLQPDGSPLPGVTVTAGNPSNAVTDANGSFIILDPDLGTIEVLFDGSTAAVSGSTFPELLLQVTVNATGTTVLPPVTLPDLDDPASADTDVAVDAGGAATQAFSAQGTGGDTGVSGPSGTEIVIDGQPASGTVNLSITPVAPEAVPVPLPESAALDAAGFVTIRPAGAEFDTGNGEGLDVRLPNDRGFPLGGMVDIYSYDYDEGVWHNRSQETGNQGQVVDLGGGLFAIDGSGVITEGGSHCAVMPVDTNCATTLRGRVIDQDGDPIPGTSLATSLGQLAATGADGTFSIPNVPAYVVADLPTCTSIGVAIDFTAPVDFGAAMSTVNVPAANIVSGGITNLGDIVITVPDTGGLAGLVADNGAGVPGAMVDVSGPTTTTITAGPSGSFFQTGMLPGDYTASFPFAGDPAATEVTFSISANETTTIGLQRSAGTGARSVTILVLFNADGEPPPSMPPVAGAKVLLIGSDTGSAAGIEGVTNEDGRVTFEDVDGPFTVTAQLDIAIPGNPGEVARVASTLLDIQPASSTIGILLSGFGVELGPVDATLSGTVSNRPVLGQDENLIIDVRARGEQLEFHESAEVNPTTGAYTIDIPSGEILDVSLSHRDFEYKAKSAIVVFGIGPASSGGTITRDFDYGSSAVIPFDQTVNMTYNNTFSALYEDVGVTIEDPSAPLAPYLHFSVGVSGLPATVMIPDVTASNLTGLDVFLTADQGGEDAQGDEVDSECDVRLTTTPTAFTFRFEDVPTINTPASGATLTVAQAEMLAVDFASVTGGLPGGLYLADIYSENTGLAVDRMVWSIFLPRSRSSFTLPPAALPMFGSGGTYELDVEVITTDDPPLDFNTAWDETLAQNIQALLNADEQCYASHVIYFSTQ